MITKDKITEEFLLALKEIEPQLLMLQFKPFSYYEKGPAYYIQYKKKGTGSIVEFIFGPPEYAVEISISTAKGKFTFKDLLRISKITEWVNNNRYIQKSERIIKNEIFYFVELLKVALPIIE